MNTRNAHAGLHADAMSRSPERPLLLLLGPTGSGKTEVALALAARVPIEVVSADSRQVYRGLDVGTAKPNAAERRRLAHSMVDVADPDDPMSAGRYAREAWDAIEAVRTRGAEPLVAGGAGLYVRALLGGLAANLPSDPAVRARLEAEADAEDGGSAALHARLAAIDPDAARRIAPQDRVRIVRALEVIELTGQPISALHRAGAAAATAAPVAYRAVYLDRAPADLAARIAARADAMLGAGLVEETRAVVARWPGAEPLLRKTVGYAEVLRAAEERWSAAALREALVRATVQYARRQRIWFQKMQGLVRVPVAAGAAPERVAAAVQEMLGSVTRVSGSNVQVKCRKNSAEDGMR